MDFMKLLKRFRGEQSALPAEEHASDRALSTALLAITSKRQINKGTEFGSEAIAELSDRFEELLRILKEEFDGRLDNPMRAFACRTGAFESLESKSRSKARTPFLFLRVPNKPGYLLEEAKLDQVIIYRASESRTLLWNESDASIDKSPLFIRKAREEATLTRVQPDLWEATWATETRQTLSSHQLAQTILAQAVKELVAS